MYEDEKVIRLHSKKVKHKSPISGSLIRVVGQDEWFYVFKWTGRNQNIIRQFINKNEREKYRYSFSIAEDTFVIIPEGIDEIVSLDKGEYFQYYKDTGKISKLPSNYFTNKIWRTDYEGSVEKQYFDLKTNKSDIVNFSF